VACIRAFLRFRSRSNLVSVLNELNKSTARCFLPVSFVSWRFASITEKVSTIVAAQAPEQKQD